jgi:hypothetical protein
MRLRQEALSDAGAQLPQPHGPKAGRVASEQSFASKGRPPVPPAGVRSIGRVPVLRQLQRQNARQDEQLVLTRADPQRGGLAHAQPQTVATACSPAGRKAHARTDRPPTPGPQRQGLTLLAKSVVCQAAARLWAVHRA